MFHRAINYRDKILYIQLKKLNIFNGNQRTGSVAVSRWD